MLECLDAGPQVKLGIRMGSLAGPEQGPSQKLISFRNSAEHDGHLC